MYQTPMRTASEPVPVAAVRLVKLSAALNRVAAGAVLVTLGVLVLSAVDASAAYVVGGALLVGGVLVVLLRRAPLFRLLAAVLNTAAFLIVMDVVRLGLAS
jgi:hypothetical protein